MNDDTTKGQHLTPARSEELLARISSVVRRGLDDLAESATNNEVGETKGSNIDSGEEEAGPAYAAIEIINIVMRLSETWSDDDTMAERRLAVLYASRTLTDTIGRLRSSPIPVAALPMIGELARKWVAKDSTIAHEELANLVRSDLNESFGELTISDVRRAICLYGYLTAAQSSAVFEAVLSLSNAMKDQTSLEEASESYRATVKIVYWTLLDVHEDCAKILESEGRLEEALEHKVMELRLLDEFPECAKEEASAESDIILSALYDGVSALIDAQSELADVLQSVGREEDAKDMIRASIHILELGIALGKPQPSSTRAGFGGLASSVKNRGVKLWKSLSTRSSNPKG